MGDYPENVVPLAIDPRRAVNLTPHEALQLVGRVARHRGAISVEVTVTDRAGRELPHGVEWSADPELRVQAHAQFPDGHILVGSTEPIDRGDFISDSPAKFGAWQTIACANLLERFLPLHPSEEVR